MQQHFTEATNLLSCRALIVEAMPLAVTILAGSLTFPRLTSGKFVDDLHNFVLCFKTVKLNVEEDLPETSTRKILCDL